MFVMATITDFVQVKTLLIITSFLYRDILKKCCAVAKLRQKKAGVVWSAVRNYFLEWSAETQYCTAFQRKA
jgi:hypothetical protein